jgi:hypothetical protein
MKHASTSLLAALAILLAGLPATVATAAEGEHFGIVSFSLRTTRSAERAEGIARVIENIPVPFDWAGGRLDGQDGGPDSLTGTVRFAQSAEGVTAGPKDIVVSLPDGLIGDPMAVPRCSLAKLLATGEHCPADTQIGVARVQLGKTELLGPVANVTPETGQSAEFAIENHQKLVFLETAHLVRTATGYGFALVSNKLPTAGVTEVEQTIWGVPADPLHDPERGLFCDTNGIGLSLCEEKDLANKLPDSGGEPSGLEPVPFLTMPDDCAAGPETTTARADSWAEPGRVLENQKYEGFVERKAEDPLPNGGGAGFTGCDLLKFEPAIEVTPDRLLADEPIGLGVSVQVPQREEPTSLATPDVRDATVSLPPGMSISPGAVDGIQACDATGSAGINITGPESEEVGLDGELQLAPGHCPDASIVGTAEAITPLLPEPVKGHVYLAKPGCPEPPKRAGEAERPCTEQDALDGNLYRLYLELGGVGPLAKTGIDIKVEGQTDVNPATGQITTRFLNDPDTPFSDLVVHLEGGPRAALANPATCGLATTTSDFVPWSTPGTTPQGRTVAGTPDATPSSFFEVGGCAVPRPLNPGFAAGTVTPQAGQFTDFAMSLSRQDREQFVKGLQVRTPAGLLGMLANVPLCGEAEANAGACPASSKIGTTRVATGAGSHPFEIKGDVYLTGPYRGAPFGLSVVVHVAAGPFDLGVRVVRARIAVDRDTSTLTVATDESGPFAIPQIVFGVPVRLRRVAVYIDRPEFMLNPTGCRAKRIAATVAGDEGALAEAASPFAVGGCKGLAFKPSFIASTKAKTSRARGASLDTKLSYPKGALGADANIARVKVSLPRQLPSRLTTLQKACPASTFEANPAHCPAASVVGIVRASTPVLPVGLAGPVYFVSHGGEAFPSLVIVLEGDGVRVDLTGTTFISKRGITSSTFKTVPDVPVNTFELYLPQGPFSALAANGNLCKGRLVMPTEFVAQNGATLRRKTQIAVRGCEKAHGARKARRGGRK